MPVVWGVVNVTPDSFSDGGRFSTTDLAIRHGLSLVDEGADVVDVGGESTRPGASRVSIDTEMNRVLPVVAGLVEAEHTCMSVRGVRKAGSMTVTSAMRGTLLNAATRAEAMALIKAR